MACSKGVREETRHVSRPMSQAERWPVFYVLSNSVFVFRTFIQNCSSVDTCLERTFTASHVS